VDQRPVFGLRLSDLERLRCGGQCRRQRDAPLGRLVACDEHELQRGDFVAPGSDLAPVDRCRRQQDVCLADLHSGPDRLRAERGKQRCEDKTGLERADGGAIELRRPAHECEQPVALRQPMGRQHIGEARRQVCHVRIGQFAAGVVLADPADGDFAAMALRDMPVDRLIADVQRAARQPRQQRPRLLPVEACPRRVGICQGGSRPIRIILADDRLHWTVLPMSSIA